MILRLWRGGGARCADGGHQAQSDGVIPVLIGVELDELRGALRRYGLEYLVICESSAAAASDGLARLAADARPVAIVCAPAAMIETGGGEFLTMAAGLSRL